MEMLRIKAKYNLKPYSDDLRHMRDVNDYLKQTAVKAIESASCLFFRGMSAIFVLALAAGCKWFISSYCVMRRIKENNLYESYQELKMVPPQRD